MNEKEIEIKIQKLPGNLKKKVLEYIDFLLSKYQNRQSKVKKFKFDWEGGLSDLKDKFSSVDLQHKSLQWR